MPTDPVLTSEARVKIVPLPAFTTYAVSEPSVAMSSRALVPLKVRPLVPKAEGPAMTTVPAVRVVLICVLAPARTSVPLPALVRV